MLLFCPLKADSLYPDSLHQYSSHFIKRDKSITQRIGCNWLVFEMFGLGLSAKRLFNGLTDERHAERLLRWLQKQKLSLGTCLKINTTWLVIPLVRRTFLRETFVEKNH